VTDTLSRGSIQQDVEALMQRIAGDCLPMHQPDFFLTDEQAAVLFERDRERRLRKQTEERLAAVTGWAEDVCRHLLERPPKEERRADLLRRANDLGLR
jgi:hypothetical protein